MIAGYQLWLAVAWKLGPLLPGLANRMTRWMARTIGCRTPAADIGWVVWHAGEAAELQLPPGSWALRLDSARALVAGGPGAPAAPPVDGRLVLSEPTVCVLVRSLHGPTTPSSPAS